MIKLIRVRGNPKYSSEPEFQKPNHAVPNCFWNSEKVRSWKAARQAGESGRQQHTKFTMFHYADDANELRF